MSELSPSDCPGTSTLLAVDSIRSGYGKKEILHGVSFEVPAGKIVGMIGPNGSGKSTALKTVFGLVKAQAGRVRFDGALCDGLKPPALIEKGLVYVPQGNRVFSDLSIRANLTVSLRGVGKAETARRLAEMADLFPFLGNNLRKSAGELSGGEKQQVALAMGLMKKPKMLLLDEPTLGLAPNLLGDVFGMLKRINQEMGVTILVVEHKVREAFRIADRVLGLRRGEIVEEGPPSKFDEKRLKSLFLG